MPGDSFPSMVFWYPIPRKCVFGHSFNHSHIEVYYEVTRTVLRRVAPALAFASQAVAANRFSVATGNWNATSTWAATSGGASGASVPVAGDVVTIEGGDVVTVNISNAACASVQLGSLTGGGGAGTLVFSSGSQLTVSGAFVLGANGSTSRFGTLTMTSGGTLICASLSKSERGGRVHRRHRDHPADDDEFAAGQ